jgi:plastocyanin
MQVAFYLLFYFFKISAPPVHFDAGETTMPPVKSYFLKKSTWFAAALMMISAIPLKSSAVTYTVQFGDSWGLSYTPNSFAARVGDTVKWVGDFSAYPLRSAAIPSGAVAWEKSGGTEPFYYSIRIPGAYGYYCDDRIGKIMAGSFSAEPSGVKQNHGLLMMKSLAVRTNLSPGSIAIKMVFSRPEVVSIKLYTLELISLSNVFGGQQPQEIVIPQLKKGIYFLRVSSKEEMRTLPLFILQ